MSGWFKYLSIFVITALFSISLMAFIFNIEVANNAPTNLMNDPSLSNLNKSMQGFLSNFSTASDAQYNASASETTVVPTGAFVLFSILSSIGRFLALPFTLIGDLFSALSSVLGVDPGILGIITMLILLAGIFLWYKFTKIAD